MGKKNGGGLFSLLVKAIARIIHVKPGGSIITNRGQQHMARNTSTFYPKCLFTYTWFLYFFSPFFRENKIGGKKWPSPLCCNIYYFCYCLNKEMLEVHGMLYLLELDIWHFFTFRFITLSCSSELC